MKFVKSKLLQKAEGRKQGKYLITLEVTDYDIVAFEDLAWVDLKSLRDQDLKRFKQLDKYLEKAFHVFWKLWRLYDK